MAHSSRVESAAGRDGNVRAIAHWIERSWIGGGRNRHPSKGSRLGAICTGDWRAVGSCNLIGSEVRRRQIGGVRPRRMFQRHVRPLALGKTALPHRSAQFPPTCSPPSSVPGSRSRRKGVPRAWPRRRFTPNRHLKLQNAFFVGAGPTCLDYSGFISP